MNNNTNNQPILNSSFNVRVYSVNCHPTTPSFGNALVNSTGLINLDNDYLWVNNTISEDRCINTCEIATTLPSDGTQFDFGLVKYQNISNNNAYNIIRTEGDRRYMLRYHSGRNRRSDQNGGFDHILFEYREWYWIPEFKNGNNINPLFTQYEPPSVGGSEQETIIFICLQEK